jgi:anti-anti-sigma regulatory factor
MSFRIDRVVVNHVVVLFLSGKLTGEHVETFRNVVRQESGALAIDLKNVSLVDRDAAKFLGQAEQDRAELRNCPKYVREWVNRERAGMHEGN